MQDIPCYPSRRVGELLQNVVKSSNSCYRQSITRSGQPFPERLGPKTLPSKLWPLWIQEGMNNNWGHSSFSFICSTRLWGNNIGWGSGCATDVPSISLLWLNGWGGWLRILSMSHRQTHWNNTRWVDSAVIPLRWQNESQFTGNGDAASAEQLHFQKKKKKRSCSHWLHTKQQ